MPPSAVQVHQSGITSWADLANNARQCELLFPADNRIQFSGTSNGVPVRLGGLSAPEDATDATNKAYVDAAIQGLTFKKPVKVGFLENRALAELVAGAAVQHPVIEGVVTTVTVEAGDRILLMGQINASDNGIWEIVTGGSPPVRPLDFGGGVNVCHASGTYVFVDSGTLMDRAYVCITDRGLDVVGQATALEWVQFSARQSAMAGFGLAVGTGMELDVDKTVVPWLAAAENTFTGTIRAPKVTGLSTAAITANGDAVNLELMTQEFTRRHNAHPYKEPVRLAIPYNVPDPAATLVAGFAPATGSLYHFRPETEYARAAEAPLATGDRILLVGQTAPGENGIWVVGAAAAARSADMPAGTAVPLGVTIPDASGNVFVVTQSGTIGADGVKAMAQHTAWRPPVSFVVEDWEAFNTDPGLALSADADGKVVLPTGAVAHVGERILINCAYAADNNDVWIVAPYGQAARMAADSATTRMGSLLTTVDGSMFRCVLNPRAGLGPARWWRNVSDRTKMPVQHTVYHNVPSPSTALVHDYLGFSQHERVLLLGQNDPIECGIWVVAPTGQTARRAKDMQTGTEVRVGTTVVDNSGDLFILCGSDSPTAGYHPLNGWTRVTRGPTPPVMHIMDAPVPTPLETLVCGPDGTLSLFGATLQPGDRVFLADQADPTECRVWLVAAAGLSATPTTEVPLTPPTGTVVSDRNGRAMRYTASGTWVPIAAHCTVRRIFKHHLENPWAALVCGEDGTVLVNGTTLSAGDRVLLTAQADSTENVVWIVAAAGRPVGRVAKVGTNGVNGAVVTDVDGRLAVGGTTPDGTIRWTRSQASAVCEPVKFALTVNVADPAATLMPGYGLPTGGNVGEADRVLLIGQNNVAENGIWLVTATGAVRSDDMPNGSVVRAGTLITDAQGTVYVIAQQGTVGADGFRAVAQHAMNRPPVAFAVEDYVANPETAFVAGPDGTVVLPWSGERAKVGDRILLTWGTGGWNDRHTGDVYVVAPEGSLATLAADSFYPRLPGTTITLHDGRQFVVPVESGDEWWRDTMEHTKRPVARTYSYHIPDPATTLVDGFDNLWFGARVLLLGQTDPKECGVWVVADEGKTAIRAADMQHDVCLKGGTTVADVDGNMFAFRGVNLGWGGFNDFAWVNYDNLDNWARFTDRYTTPVNHIFDERITDPAQTLSAGNMVFGKTLESGMRVMLIGQENGDDNAIWIVTPRGQPTQRTTEVSAHNRVGTVVTDYTGRSVVASAPWGVWTCDRSAVCVKHIFDAPIADPVATFTPGGGRTVTVRGITFWPGDRVLLISQANPAENMVWTVGEGADTCMVPTISSKWAEGVTVTDRTGRAFVGKRQDDGNVAWTPDREIHTVHYILEEPVPDPQTALVCSASGSVVFEGRTLTEGSRVLLTGQIYSAEQNTIWEVAAAGGTATPISILTIRAGTVVQDRTGRTAAYETQSNGSLQWVMNDAVRPVWRIFDDVVSEPWTALTAGEDGTVTILGVTLSAGQRVHLIGQPEPTHNGTWIVARPGQPVRLLPTYATADRSHGMVVVDSTGRVAVGYVDTATGAVVWVDRTKDGGHLKLPVAAASTTDVGVPEDALRQGIVLDGVSLAAGDRVLLKDQTDAVQNGLWIVGTDTLPAMRASDLSPGSRFAGALVVVSGGNRQAMSRWTAHGSPTACTGSAAMPWTYSGSERPLQHPPVRVGTTGPIADLETVLRSGYSVDGVVLVAGDRVLVKNQTVSEQNGVWVVGDSVDGVVPQFPVPVRAADFAVGDYCGGAQVWVASGTQNQNTMWTCTSPVGCVGVHPITFEHLLNHRIVPWLQLDNTFTQTNTFTGSTVFNAPTTTNQLSTFTAPMVVSDSTASTSQTTGAVVVAGGIGVAGNVFCTGSYNLSDERLKTDFVSLETHALDVIDALHGYEFTWRTAADGTDPKYAASNAAAGRTGRSVGVKAQEVEAAGATLCVSRDNDGILSVEYTKLVPYLIESVRILKRRVEELEGAPRAPKRARRNK